VLVLTRRKDQRIVIGDDVIITVLEVKGDTVRIGIEAPRSVQVHREEVHEALVQANRDALMRAGAPGDAAALPDLPPHLPPGRLGGARPAPLSPRPGGLAPRPGGLAPRPGPVPGPVPRPPAG
jgi:carbon storage regulator